MNKLQYWENQRLIKELQFVESDFYYLDEMIKCTNPLFIKAINDLVSSIPEIKEAFENNQPETDLSDNNPESEISEEIIDNPKSVKPIDSNIKNLYRQIVKKTHPDKVSNLESVYIEATKAYESYDISTILQISWNLEIPFEMTDEYRKEITDKIMDFREKKLFLENSLTFKWLKSDEKNKPLIVVEYLKNKMFV